MGQGTKTDNKNLGAKLGLRRHFLEKFHAGDPATVMDCCQGNGVIWRVLRSEFKIARYWGMDLKAEPGRLVIDSARVLAQRGWTENLIDIDTYGSPWEHWFNMLPNVTRPLTVFLTIGFIKMGGGGNVDRLALEAMGLGKLKCPPSLTAKLHDRTIDYCIAAASKHGVKVSDVTEVLPKRGSAYRNVRYLGMRLEPSQQDRAA